MENNELIKRAEDLARRAERSGMVCATNFLSPAEQYELRQKLSYLGDRMVFNGGGEDCERTLAFFLPDYMEPDMLDVSEYISAMCLRSYFGEPGHRDYMGALLGMGIGREWLGDIRVIGDRAYVFCRESVLRHLLTIEKAGRYTVRAEQLELSQVPVPERKVEKLSFTVMSMRLDAVAGGMFRLSRTEAAKQINAGNVSLNYSQCLKTDCVVQPGDVISLKGAGKGSVTGTGGNSKKGRLFVYAEVLK